MVAQVKKFRRFAAFMLIALVLLTTLAPVDLQACAVCYGEPDAPASRGLTWAIVALGGIVGMVLSAVVVFFVHTGRNAAAIEQLKEEK